MCYYTISSHHHINDCINILLALNFNTLLKSYQSTYTWKGQVYDISSQFDTCIRSKADFCLVYYRYKLDIDTSVFFLFWKK
jgi:hypothetical protein